VALTGLLEIGKTLPEEDYSKQVGYCVDGGMHWHRSIAYNRALPSRVLDCLAHSMVPGMTPLSLLRYAVQC
jgi:hypothetical protein